ncbi:hypothetical protein niasHT_002355 [Heterodera trifolii]|uniref:Uncharacterized protein n=1 Tax=Heterodera trifolii TaxID=157864 RepID=A0ABD2LM24_9BILA
MICQLDELTPIPTVSPAPSFLHTYQNNRSQILFLKPNCFYCETSNQHNSSFLKRCIVVVVEESTKGMFRRVRRGLGLKKFLVFRSSVFRKCVAPIMYIAVRVDSKAAARKVMENFSTDGELLGFKVEMTWFRDIRRYLAHCAKQGSRPSRFRGRSDYRRDDEQYKGRGRSRSPTRSPEREEGARSRSASAASRHSNANRRRSQSRSHSARSHSHSRSLSSGGEVRAARDGNASHSEREKSLDYSDIEEAYFEFLFFTFISLIFVEESSSFAATRSVALSAAPKKVEEREAKEGEAAAPQQAPPSLADHRQPHSGSDMEMGGEEEDGLSNGGGRKMLKMESSSPVNNSRRLRWPTTAIPTRARTWKWAGRRRTDCPTAEDAKCAKWSHRRPSTTARHVGVSPPKFKPIGELSDYQQQINGSQGKCVTFGCVSNIRFAAPPPQPPLVLRNLPLPPVTTNNEMMVDRTCRNNTAKEDDAQLFGRRVVKFLRSLNNGRSRRRACIGIEQVMIEFETEEEEEQKR